MTSPGVVADSMAQNPHLRHSGFNIQAKTTGVDPVSTKPRAAKWLLEAWRE